VIDVCVYVILFLFACAYRALSAFLGGMPCVCHSAYTYVCVCAYICAHACAFVCVSLII